MQTACSPRATLMRPSAYSPVGVDLVLRLGVALGLGQDHHTPAGFFCGHVFPRDFHGMMSRTIMQLP